MSRRRRLRRGSRLARRRRPPHGSHVRIAVPYGNGDATTTEGRSRRRHLVPPTHSDRQLLANAAREHLDSRRRFPGMSSNASCGSSPTGTVRASTSRVQSKGTKVVTVTVVPTKGPARSSPARSIFERFQIGVAGGPQPATCAGRTLVQALRPVRYAGPKPPWSLRPAGVPTASPRTGSVHRRALCPLLTS